MHLKEDVLYINTYEMVILAIMLYTCETQSLLLGEGHKLQVFEIKIDEIIFTEER